MNITNKAAVLGLLMGAALLSTGVQALERLPEQGVRSIVTACPGSSEYVYVGGMLYRIGSATPNPAEMDMLYYGYQKALKAFKGDNYIWIYVKGYTDSTGGDIDNEKLGWNRARLIAKGLVARGVNPELIKIHGFIGRTHPLYDNSTALGRQFNRQASGTIHAMDKTEVNACLAEHPESVLQEPWWENPDS